jgi:hypothetical protein
MFFDAPILIAGASSSRFERKGIQTVAIIANHIEFGPMQATSAGQNAAQAVQDGLYYRLICYRARHFSQTRSMVARVDQVIVRSIIRCVIYTRKSSDEGWSRPSTRLTPSAKPVRHTLPARSISTGEY